MKNEWFKMKKSSFVEGTLIATLAIIFVKLLGMVYVIPFYALIGEKGSSLYAYAYTIYTIFLDISSAGLPIAISKVITEFNTLNKQEAKIRAYRIGKSIMIFLAVCVFIILMLLAPQIASLLLGDLSGGNTIEDVTFVIRTISFAILIIPFLSVSKGFLQGHNIINVSSISQVIEQIIRITIILLGSYLCVRVFKTSEKIAVGVSVTGAFFGGLIAYLFVKRKLKENKKELGLCVKYEEKDDVTSKEIVKKIFSYAIPFIIINTVYSLYNFVDMTLILRYMNHLGFEALDVEFVATTISTWAPKINMIIVSFAMGMTMSLIPNIVEAFTLKKWEQVERKLNQALQIILFISIPCTIGISLLSSSIWTVFYGYNTNGSIILAVNIFTALFLNIYTITSSALQGLNKFKLVYKTTITGFVLNALLDIPFMYLFNKIGIPPFLGACTATIIGNLASSIISLTSLSHEHGIKYKETFKVLMKMIFPTIAMLIVVILLKMLIPINYDSKISCIIYIGVISLMGGITYIGIAYKTRIINKVFGKNMVNRIIKKLTFNKISLN